MKRVFAAIDISSDARQATKDYVARLRRAFPETSVRWEPPEKLHITVKFAGSLDEERLGIFMERVETAGKSVAPFQIKISGTGAFIKRRGPSALWMGVEQVADVDTLGMIATLLGHEDKPFHAHVTIARIKDAKKAKELIQWHCDAEFRSDVVQVNELVIYESELLSGGSIYTRINGYGLGAFH